MSSELRFVFDLGDPRVEEINKEREVVKKLHADFGTIEGFFNVWIKEGVKKFKTIDQLEKIAQKY